MPLPGWGLPAAMGVEGAGRVEAVGDGVENLAPGDRVAWFYHPGSYADLAAVRAESLAIGQRPVTSAGRWSARRCKSPIAWSSATRRW